ncbi:MAG: SdiA-regulated domain-containing protein [Saprospiraceae bacterium]|nr:SdiA-regulated domain-containing protein [Saprospiraceae bacterium]
MKISVRLLVVVLLSTNLLLLSYSCCIKSKEEKEKEYKAKYEKQQSQKNAKKKITKVKKVKKEVDDVNIEVEVKIEVEIKKPTKTDNKNEVEIDIKNKVKTEPKSKKEEKNKNKVQCGTLTLKKRIPIEKHNSKTLQPSGLTIQNDSLFMVSDNTHNIFSWKIDATKAKIKWDSHLDLDPIPNYPFRGSNKTQFEGITIDNNRNFYICIESKTIPLLELQRVGKNYSLVKHDDPLPNYLKKDVLGEPHISSTDPSNRLLEGVAWTSGKDLYLAYERLPRGVKKYNTSTKNEEIFHEIIQDTTCGVDFQKKDSQPDISGLYYYQQRLYGIWRQVNAVVLLDDQYNIEKIWKFGEHLTQFDREERIIEGIAMDENFLYLVTDPNGNDSIKPMVYIFDSIIYK